ncbi:MAG TPA: S41 family peptidase [Fimbriimonadaceae bacterium]|nr:S41 family peptidase [Fimbriimonadaceae bacterium]
MTTEVRKSLRAGAGVVACIGAIGFGAIWRDRVELGSPDHLNISNLVASTSNHTDLPELNFFDDIMELLKKKYVDPIDDEMKLADGSVRGMVAFLGDPNSLYMDANQYRVYNNVRKGKYEGIGADLILAQDKSKGKVQIGGPSASDDSDSRLPKLVIAAVVPGGAADKAGLKPGDWVEFVDDHWIPNSEAFDKFEALAQQVKQHKASIDEYFKMRKTLEAQAEKDVLPIKARDQLMMGRAGLVKTVWARGDQRISVTLPKGEWEMPGFGAGPDGAIRVPFVSGVADDLRNALSGKTEATLDLRNNVEGDFDAMLACLDVVAPNGAYGYLVTEKDEKPLELIVSHGVAHPIKLTLLVDRTARGAAEIFATALSSRGIAKLSGEDMAGNAYEVKWYTLPDNAGYSLVTAAYQANKPSDAIAKTVLPPDKDRLGESARPGAAK